MLFRSFLILCLVDIFVWNVAYAQELRAEAEGYRALSSNYRYGLTPIRGSQPVFSVPLPSHEPSVGRAVFGGALGWGAGMAVGVGIGLLLEQPADESMIFLSRGMIAGAMVGGALGPPLGTHFLQRNRHRGNLLLMLLASAGAQALGVLSWKYLNQHHHPGEGDLVLLVVTPIIQVSLSTVIQRVTAPR